MERWTVRLAKNPIFNGVVLSMALMGTLVAFWFPIMMTWHSKDWTYLYVGIGAWALFALGLVGIYKRFKPYIKANLL